MIKAQLTHHIKFGNKYKAEHNLTEISMLRKYGMILKM